MLISINQLNILIRKYVTDFQDFRKLVLYFVWIKHILILVKPFVLVGLPNQRVIGTYDLKRWGVRYFSKVILILGKCYELIIWSMTTVLIAKVKNIVTIFRKKKTNVLQNWVVIWLWEVNYGGEKWEKKHPKWILINAILNAKKRLKRK